MSSVLWHPQLSDRPAKEGRKGEDVSQLGRQPSIRSANEVLMRSFRTICHSDIREGVRREIRRRGGGRISNFDKSQNDAALQIEVLGGNAVVEVQPNPSPVRQYILGSIQQMALESRRTLLN